MKLSKFRIQNYRAINDSGWIEVEDIAAIVGKNESSKTSLLKALWKFNPFKAEPYSLDREWPRGRRKDRSPDQPVSTVVFEFSEDEIAELHEIDDTVSHVTGVEITKSYSGKTTYSFLPHTPVTKAWAKQVVGKIPEAVEGTASKKFKSEFKTAFSDLIGAVGGLSEFDSAQYKQLVEGFKPKINGFCSADEAEAAKDKEVAAKVVAAADLAIKDLASESPGRKAIKMASSWLPKFIYMDDHKAFKGSAHLNQVNERKTNNTLTEEDKTILLIMEMSGLNLEDEVKKGSQPDREQRMLDMSDASSTLTNEIANRWRQKKYEVQFQADGHHFMTFVKDNGAKALVPLDERSKGFQWFFSFDMTFMYETNGSFENAIILLDEPGLHLHADAQRDLLERFKSYAEDNQLIYTTHMPFMIDVRRLDNVWVAEEDPETGSRFHQDWETAGKDARFTLQAAIGMSWSQSLFVGKNNLIVEGVTDFWFLNAMSALLRDAGRAAIDERLVITPAGGATKVAYVGTLLHAQDLNVAVLLDSDKEGEAAHKQLVHQWILEKDHALLLGETLGKTGALALEDLFDEDYYLRQMKDSYKTEIGGKTLTIPQDARAIVERIGAAFETAGIGQFNKGRVAKRILNDLGKKTAADFGGSTLDNFEKVAVVLNQLVAKWEGESQPKPSKKSGKATKGRGPEATA
jgi:hypothetical protein